MLFAVYKILKDAGEGGGEKSFNSSFHEALPQDFYPKDVSQFSTEQKLKDDFERRHKKLKHEFALEKEALQKSPDFSSQTWNAMTEKHEKAEKEFQEKYKKLKAEYEMYEKELKASEAKGLR
jgi:flagellar biosynthesis GTPase FlhF